MILHFLKAKYPIRKIRKRLFSSISGSPETDEIVEERWELSTPKWFQIEEARASSAARLAYLLNIHEQQGHALLKGRYAMLPRPSEWVRRLKSEIPDMPTDWLLLDFDGAEYSKTIVLDCLGELEKSLKVEWFFCRYSSGTYIHNDIEDKLWMHVYVKLSELRSHSDLKREVEELACRRPEFRIDPCVCDPTRLIVIARPTTLPIPVPLSQRIDTNNRGLVEA